jgi:hypothetical protein
MDLGIQIPEFGIQKLPPEIAIQNPELPESAFQNLKFKILNTQNQHSRIPN